MAIRDIRLNATENFKVCTFRVDTGAPANASSLAVVAYPGSSTTEITAGITVSGMPFDSLVGLGNIEVVATVANGYAADTTYTLVASAGTVNSVSIVGAILGEFTIRKNTPGLVFTGVAASGAAGSVTMASPLATTADLYNGMTAAIVGGTGVGQARQVYDSNAASRRLDVSPDWVVTPDNTSVVELYSTPPAAITGTLPVVNVGQINSAAAATPGAAGGVLIAGNNAATTFTAGLTIAQSVSNTSALVVTGNGTGNGATITSGSGATGSGVSLVAASTNGSALSLSGNGSGHGLAATPGATGSGIRAIGGATSGAAVALVGTAGNAAALSLAGQGSAAGLISTGGATGHGISAVGGATSGDGISAAAATSGHGLTTTGAGTTKHGINAAGGSTTSHGIAATGGGVGHGIAATSGGGATGDGIRATSAATNGNGLNLVGNGTGDGLLATGGASAGGDGVAAVAGGGVDVRGALTGNITGNLSGSAGSVTGSVGSIASGGIVAASFAANAITSTVVADNTITAAKIGSDAITAAKVATDVTTEIAAGVISAATADPIAANIKEVNDVALQGDGTSGDKWRPA